MRKWQWIHTADVHLDAPQTATAGDRQWGSARRRELLETFERIVRIAEEQQADFLIVAGDLFDSPDVRRSVVLSVAEMFAAVPGIRIVLTTGNHDWDVSVLRQAKWSENVYWLTPERPWVMMEDVSAFFAASGFSSSDTAFEVPSEWMSAEAEFRMLLWHGSVGVDIDNRYNSVKPEFLHALNAQYVALGHTHRPKLAVGGFSEIHNPGSPEPLGFDEDGEHGVIRGKYSQEDGLECRFLPVARRRFVRIQADISGCASDEESFRKLVDAAQGTFCSDDLYEMILTGYRDTHYHPDTTRLKAMVGQRMAFCKIKDRSVAGYDLESISREPGLRGAFVRELLSRAEREPMMAEQALAAARLGLEALDTGEVVTEWENI